MQALGLIGADLVVGELEVTECVTPAGMTRTQVAMDMVPSSHSPCEPGMRSGQVNGYPRLGAVAALHEPAGIVVASCHTPTIARTVSDGPMTDLS